MTGLGFWGRVMRRPSDSGVLREIHTWILPRFPTYLARETGPDDTVLDLGCGRSSPIQFCRKSLSVGVELFEPYLLESKREHIHDQYVRADVTRIEFKPRSFDVVIAIDVLEHLDKLAGRELLGRMETWAKRRVVVFTPNGFLRQEPYHENALQEHRSGWTVEEFRSLGFEVHGINGWKRLRGEMAVPRYQPVSLWEKISDVTQKVTYYWPEMAFQLLATKETRNRDVA
jgi:SAM-dependent methyltransferase